MQKRGLSAGAVIILGLLSAAGAAASEEGDAIFSPLGVRKGTALKLLLPPDEIYRRTQAVLQHFGAATEPDSQPLVESLARKQTEAGAAAALPFLDPHGQWTRFSSVKSPAGSDARLVGFLDRDGKTFEDFTVPFAAPGTEAAITADFAERLRQAARQNPPEKALRGLRIALDPGHMGGDLWDGFTGKFVSDGHGHKLSEGVMALQVTLLLERAFTALGADVLLTRRTLAPVSAQAYQNLDVREFGLIELTQNSLQAWFQELLAASPAGPALFAAFEASPTFKSYFADSARLNYFIKREDLRARVEKIDAFNPDITLIIHFDTSDPPGNPTGMNPRDYDATKAYVAGGFVADELSSRASRSEFARHLMDLRAWDASRALGREIVHQFGARLGLKPDVQGGEFAEKVEPGVFARNLYLNRRISGHALSYVECLYYNGPTEFHALSAATHPMDIGGESRPYSDRLAQVAESLQASVLAFVAGQSR